MQSPNYLTIQAKCTTALLPKGPPTRKVVPHQSPSLLFWKVVHFCMVLTECPKYLLTCPLTFSPSVKWSRDTPPWRHMLIHRDRRNCQRSWNDGHLGNPSMCLQDLLRSITRTPLPMMADCGHCPLRGIWTKTWLFSSVIAQMTPTQDETIVSMPINHCQRSASVSWII